jgi:hypothetical protein
MVVSLAELMAASLAGQLVQLKAAQKVVMMAVQKGG